MLASKFAQETSGRRGTGSVRLFDLRVILGALAIIVLAQGLWILGVELIRGAFPDARHRVGAQKSVLAARVALIRGDLWAQAALARSGFDIGEPAALPPAAALLKARGLADHALSLGPIDPQIWLLLAAADLDEPPADAHADSADQISALQMAYLTGQGDRQLLPLRLMIAARSGALADKAFQDFVRLDVDYAAGAPDLKPALLAALGVSSPTNRPVLEEMIKAADPAFAAPSPPDGK